MQKFMDIFTGWHVALYIADFSRAYRAAQTADILLKDNPFFDRSALGTLAYTKWKTGLKQIAGHGHNARL